MKKSFLILLTTLWTSTLFVGSSHARDNNWEKRDNDFQSNQSAIVLDIVNSTDVRYDLRKIESHLNDVDVHLEPHAKLLKLARRLRLRAEELDDPRVLRMLSRRLRISFFIVLNYVDSSELRASLISGDTGRELWAKSYGIPEGGLLDRHWFALASKLAEKINPGFTDRSAMNFSPEDSNNDIDHSNSATHSFSIHVGAIAQNRSFAASGVKSLDNPLTGGIEYTLGFVPGFAIDTEVTPLKNVPSLGLGVGYERAFFRTKQTTIIPIANDMNGGSDSESKLLESSYSKFFARLFYRKVLSNAIELTGGLRTRILEFSIDGDSDYQGVSYLTLDFELDSFMPIATKQLGLCLGGSISPVVSFGDSIQELGSTHSTFGVSASAGLAFRAKSGFSLKGLAEYANFASDVQGTGRDGRMIEKALDQYVTLKLLGGYIY
ncbi:MAG: hypothetical protein ACPGQS_10760 [Bradymonadia bacterium]